MISGNDVASKKFPLVQVHSSRVQYSDEWILSEYSYETTKVTRELSGAVFVTPLKQDYLFRTSRKVPKLGVMLVGWGGNNGSTLTAGLLANRKQTQWHTKTGLRSPDFVGSLTQCGTLRMGEDINGESLWVPFNSILPMVNPNDLVLSGWDINRDDLSTAMKKAQVLDYDLQRQLASSMADLKPLRSIYYPHFIAANQQDRADNVLPGRQACQEHLDQLRSDIREFRESKQLDKVMVIWTANTERFCDVQQGVHDTRQNLLSAIKRGNTEISPSTMFAVASILEGCCFINGSPQNTLVPGVVELAGFHGVFVGGDDFKTGQTKLKSVLVDFLVSAGIKPCSIVSYNHLGNNDGKNLSAPAQFRSKEISKSNVVDDMVESNPILYAPGEKPDHCVVIKYVPHVGDSKRALDEYSSEIFLGGNNTIAIHNTCEDSLLAAPLILDLIILTELFQRIEYKTKDMEAFSLFHPVLSVLSYLLKAPMVPEGTPVVNALFKQRACIENILRACCGLPPENHMYLEHKALMPTELLRKRVEKNCLMNGFGNVQANDIAVNGDHLSSKSCALNGDHSVNGELEPVGKNPHLANGVNGKINGLSFRA